MHIIQDVKTTLYMDVVTTSFAGRYISRCILTEFAFIYVS